MAHTDPLTGLANERTVGRILELELARAGRQGSEVSLAMFDIDDFQATNRESGNEAGDDVLRRVAAVLAESVRLVDTVGRIGGDEFVLVAPGSAGVTVARRVLDGIAALPPVGGRQITVSAGVARFPVDGADAEALIAAATDGLARAREEGRGLGRVGDRARRLSDPERRPDQRAVTAPSPFAGQPAPVATPFEMIGIVGVVAPGPGSRVRARTSGPEVGRPEPSNTAVPALPTVKLPSGTGAAVAGDDPGRVDLAAGGRRERLHRDA